MVMVLGPFALVRGMLDAALGIVGCLALQGAVGVSRAADCGWGSSCRRAGLMQVVGWGGGWSGTDPGGLCASAGRPSRWVRVGVLSGSWALDLRCCSSC